MGRSTALDADCVATAPECLDDCADLLLTGLPVIVAGSTVDEWECGTGAPDVAYSWTAPHEVENVEHFDAGTTVILVVDGHPGTSRGFVLRVGEVATEETDCADGFDDDFDQQTDCADPDCGPGC